MARIRKDGTARWQAQVARLGVRKSKVFDFKQEAKDWAPRVMYRCLRRL